MVFIYWVKQATICPYFIFKVYFILTPQQYCLQKAQQSGSSFVVSFKFLSQDKRDAMIALYAFCREVDDVVDDCSDVGVAQTTLNWWRNQVTLIFSGQPEHPVCQALQEHVVRFALPENEFMDIIDGMQMDLQQARYLTFADLEVYCYRAAGVVGRLSARIFGFSNNETLLYAEKLGLALQLTNIIRDVGEDARRGRIYLPVEYLQTYSVTAAEILAYKETDTFKKLMAFQIDRAKNVYQEAVALLPPVDMKKQRAGLVMAAIYYALLLEIERDGAEKVLQQKLLIPKGRKIWLALKTWCFGFKP